MASCSALPERKARAWVDLDDARGSAFCGDASREARFDFLFSAIVALCDAKPVGNASQRQERRPDVHMRYVRGV